MALLVHPHLLENSAVALNAASAQSRPQRPQSLHAEGGGIDVPHQQPWSRSRLQTGKGNGGPADGPPPLCDATHAFKGTVEAVNLIPINAPSAWEIVMVELSAKRGRG